MALTYVQSTTGAGTAELTLALAYTSNTTAGSFLICSVQADVTSQGAITVSDNINGAWTQIVANDSLGGEEFEIWCFPNNAGGAVTVSFTTAVAGVAQKQIIIAEYTGQYAVSALDSNTPLTEQAEPTASYGPLATNFNNDELIWIGFTGASVTWTPSAGFNTRQSNNAVGGVLFDSSTVAAFAGSYTMTATAASSALFGALISVKSTTSQAATPTFSPNGGAFGPSQTVTITSSTSGGTIYYTLDGSTPTHGSSSISNGGTISVSSSATVKAIASVTNFVDSAVGSATFTINGAVTTSTFNPPAGTYATSRSVVVSNADSGLSGFAQYYTTDGSTPTTGSTPVSGPITVSSSLTLKVLAVATNYSNSAVASAAYVIGGGGAVGWSPVDSRQAVPGFGPPANTGIVDEQGNVIYSAQKPPFTGNSQVSDNSAIPPTDSRAAGAPVDSRASIPENSRVAPPFGGVGEP